jgi:acetylornithine deacetylase/succinyl-diaminopimelate desuccinylase-like protein
MDYHDPAMKAAEEACNAVFGRKPVYAREGGSIPIAGQIKHDLGIETILLGFGLPHDRIHAPNERFYLPNYYRGIETVIHFLVNYAGIGK